MDDTGKKWVDSTPIVDLHCDLLAYLAFKKGRSAYSAEAKCSLPQLKKGNVLLQVLAIYSETGKNSVEFAEKQVAIYQTLPPTYMDEFLHLKTLAMPKKRLSVNVIPAIENASGLCSETEELENAFKRLDNYSKSIGPFLYISLTWNHENRFGGGNHSSVGLKSDGMRMLDYLDGKKIAIDLSHTSDALAHDILNYIDAKGLRITPIASHSNFRAIADQPRNLTDALAKEVIARGGIIGLNFVKHFVGKNCPEDFTRQVDYARSLGGLENYCFGADFFCDKDFPMPISGIIPFFYPPFSNSSCYPEVLTHLNEVFAKQELEKIAHTNFSNFLSRMNQ